MRRAALAMRCASALAALAGAPGAAWAQDVSGSVTMRYEERQAGGERTSSNTEQASARVGGLVGPGESLSLQGDVVRRDSQGQPHADVRPQVQGSLSGRRHSLSGRYAWSEDLNYRGGLGTLESSDFFATLGLRPRSGLPPLSASFSGHTSQDDASPRSIDSEFRSFTASTSHRIGLFQIQAFHGETESISRATGTSTIALSRGAALAAADAAGFVYVVDAPANRIVKFDQSGAFVLTFGSPGAGSGELNGPRGIAVSPSGEVLVTDAGNHRVERFDAGGTYLGQWGGLGTAPGRFNTPAGIAADATGIYVVDSGNGRVQKFDAAGSFILEWGTPGGGPGQLASPDGITANGTFVFVADRGNNRIQRFDTTGGGVLAWGAPGAGPGQFLSPVGVALDPTGVVYVTDALNHRVQRFTPAGAFLGTWGSKGTGDGQLDQPSGIAVTGEPRVHVVDSQNARVQIFTETGSFVRAYGTSSFPNAADERESRQDHVGIQFSQKLWDVLRVDASYAGYWTRSEEGSRPVSASRSFRQLSYLGLSLEPIRGTALSYGLSFERLASEAGSQETVTETETHQLSLSATPFDGVSASAGLTRSTYSRSHAAEARTDGLSASLGLALLPRASVTLAYGWFASYTGGDETTRQATVSLTAAGSVRDGIDATLTLAESRSENVRAGTRTVSRTAALDAYLRVTPRLSGYVHVDGTRSSTSGAGSGGDSWGASAIVTLGWGMSSIASLNVTNGVGFTGSDTGGSSHRFTLAAQLPLRWSRHSLTTTYMHTEVEDATTDTLGIEALLQVTRRATLRTSVQYGLSGPSEGDWVLGLELAGAL